MKRRVDLAGRLRRVGVALLLSGLTSCGGSPGSRSGLNVNLTDAPVDGASVVVAAFTGIDLQGADGALTKLRQVKELQVGQIAVHVDLAALTAGQLSSGASVSSCKGGLNLFAGATATPDDADGDTSDDGGSDPVDYMPIPFDGTTTQVSLTIPFVAPGRYTVAATCNFDVDQSPDTNDYAPNATAGQPGYHTMSWTTVNNVAVTANTTTTVTLP